MIRLVIDKVVGVRNIFGDSREEGTLLYWIPDNEVVSLKDALQSSKKFSYIMNGTCLSAEYKKYDFSKLDIDLISAINNGQARIVINDALEGSSWLPQEIENFTLYLKQYMIKSEMVTVITQNYNYAYDVFPFKLVTWSLMESFARVTSKEWVDYNDDAKKFLCLNRWISQHRFYFMYQMYKHDILDQFNWSFHGNIENKESFDSGPQKFLRGLPAGGYWAQWDIWNWTDDMAKFAEDTPHMYDIDGDRTAADFHLIWEFHYHKKESLLYIVTETSFTNDPIRDVSEKTWRPIALQMPFILIHQPFALRRLRDLGYKTFNTLWDEDYDDIVDEKKRMSAIVDLVVSLNSRKDFVELIKSCRGIVEHNFQMLRMRRPESNMISAVSNGMER